MPTRRRSSLADSRANSLAQPRDRGRLLVEASLWALTLLAVLSARRLFDSWEYLAFWLVLAVGGHATAAVTRRQGWVLGTAATASALLMVLLQFVALYPETLTLRLLPAISTLRAVAADIADAWRAFGIVEAPAETTPGFLAVGGAVVWAASFAADSLALRARSAGAALIPSLGVLAFVGALGTDQWRIRSAAAMVLCAVVFVAAHGVRNSAQRVGMGSTPRRRTSAPMRTALRFGAATALIAAIAVPLIPGSDAPAIVSWKDLDGTAAPSRVAISPLVNAQGRLVGTSGAELFRVEASEPAYWRVSGLGSFDGTFWGSSQSYGRASRLLDGNVGPANRDALRQEFTIGLLDSIWLPAAYRPAAYSGPNALYDPQTGTLVTTHNRRLEPGMRYTVHSDRELPSVAWLNAAGDDDVPPEIAERYLELPAEFPGDVADLADEITADAAGPYAKALALQRFFRENFVYSLRVAKGHDSARMQHFLFTDRRGYCEQFAGTYAAMARAIGLPARVAVGFTPGELVDGVYIVRGEHYHAWPEVWIDDRWVYFEPTPGRGAPGAVTYTGVPAQQVIPGDPDAAGADGSGFVGPLGLDDVQGLSGNLEGFVDVLDTEASGTPEPQWADWVVVPFFALVAVGLGWVLVVPSAVRLRRAAAHRRARNDTRLQVRAHWDDSAEALFDVGLDRRPSETHVEFADRADRRLRIDASELHALADAAQLAAFAPGPPSSQTVNEARRCSTELRSRIRAARGGWDRLGSACRPSALFAGPRSRRRG